MAFLVNGTFALGLAFIDDKDRPLRPLPGAQEFLVCPARDENIGEHFVASRSRRVVHAIAGGKKFPVAIIRGAQQVPFFVVVSDGSFFLGRSPYQYER